VTGARSVTLHIVQCLPVAMTSSVSFTSEHSVGFDFDLESDSGDSVDSVNICTTAATWKVLSCAILAVVFACTGTTLAYLVDSQHMAQPPHALASNMLQRDPHVPAGTTSDSLTAGNPQQAGWPWLSSSTVIPPSPINHSKSCEHNEELYATLCYKKCSLLTDGTHPVRQTAFSCCASAECGVMGQQSAGFVPCMGYDVSGKHECPHPPG